ncbi:hypothetical protein FGG08_006578, partial [Glutinoglossum americanum]
MTYRVGNLELVVELSYSNFSSCASKVKSFRFQTTLRAPSHSLKGLASQLQDSQWWPAKPGNILDMTPDSETETFFEYADASLVPFQVLRFLGHGSFACVEEVRHTSDGTVFARKSTRVRAFQAAKITEAVQREVGIVQRLRHAHVISIRSVYREPKSIGIIMLPVADGDLDWFYEKCADENFPAELLSLLRVWFACLSDALAYIHDQNVRHKDIKPGNILVRDELVYFTDFGLAKDFDSEMTSSTEGYVFGKTPMYSPPEIISEGKRSRSADIFSLGCVFTEMATLLDRRSIAEFIEHRVKGNTYAYYKTLDNVAEWLRGSTCFDNFIRRMLSIQPEKRPSAAKIRHIVSRGGVDGVVGLNCQHRLTGIPEPQDSAEVLNDTSTSDVDSQVPTPELVHLSGSIDEIYNANTSQPDGSLMPHVSDLLPEIEAPSSVLERGENIDANGRLKQISLHEAACSGDEAAARLLLEMGVDVATKDKSGWTALHWAAERGHEAVVQLLLEKGADVAAKDEPGLTALHLAAWMGREAVAQLLLEKGADVAAKDESGWTALHLAAWMGREA